MVQGLDYYVETRVSNLGWREREDLENEMAELKMAPEKLHRLWIQRQKRENSKFF